MTKPSPKWKKTWSLDSLTHSRFDVSNMAGVLQEAETAYSSGAPESTPGFLVGSMLFICFYFLMLCLCCFCLVLAVLRSLSVIVDFPLPWISHWYFFISLIYVRKICVTSVWHIGTTFSAKIALYIQRNSQFFLQLLRFSINSYIQILIVLRT